MNGPDESARGGMSSSRQHALGLMLILFVSLIWVGSAELIQFIFGRSDYNKPLFLTYFSTSLFCLYLLGFFMFPTWRTLIGAPKSNVRDYSEVPDVELVSDPSDSTPSELLAPSSSSSGPDTSVALAEPYSPYNVRQVLEISLLLAPMFFISNYAFNAGLALTSVSSSSTISSTSSLFSLALGAAMGVERYSSPKLLASVLTLAGVAVISGQDKSAGGDDTVLGDIVSVLSAFVYGMYATTLKKKVPSEELASMAMMLGFLGLVTAFTCWPLVIVVHVLKIEEFDVPSIRVVGLLLLNALIGSVISDYLWARSVALTTPVIATLALSLTVPVSLIADYWLRSLHISMVYSAGVAMVLTGFFIANADEALARRAADV